LLLYSPITRDGLQKLIVTGAQALGLQDSSMEKNSREKGVQEQHEVGDVRQNSSLLSLGAKDLWIK